MTTVRRSFKVFIDKKDGTELLVGETRMDGGTQDEDRMAEAFAVVKPNLSLDAALHVYQYGATMIARDDFAGLRVVPAAIWEE